MPFIIVYIYCGRDSKGIFNKQTILLFKKPRLRRKNFSVYSREILGEEESLTLFLFFWFLSISGDEGFERAAVS